MSRPIRTLGVAAGAGVNDYPSNWPEIALAIKRRARWVCERCLRDHNVEAGYCLTVHHLDLDRHCLERAS